MAGATDLGYFDEDNPPPDSSPAWTIHFGPLMTGSSKVTPDFAERLRKHLDEQGLPFPAWIEVVSEGPEPPAE